MPVYPIFPRWSTMPIALIEANSYAEALAIACGEGVRFLYADFKGIVVSGICLAGADFRGADLIRADFRGADLRRADLRTARLVETVLRQAVLRNADLRHADIRQADLRNADLEHARLVGADLRGTLLHGAKLSRAVLDWRWSTVALELIRSKSADMDGMYSVVADLAFQADERPYSWLRVLNRHGSAVAGRVLGVLAKHIHPDDNSPPLLRQMIANLPVQGSDSNPTVSPTSPANTDRIAPDQGRPDDQPATLPMLWIRRGTASRPPTKLRAS